MEDWVKDAKRIKGRLVFFRILVIILSLADILILGRKTTFYLNGRNREFGGYIPWWAAGLICLFLLILLCIHEMYHSVRIEKFLLEEGQPEKYRFYFTNIYTESHFRKIMPTVHMNYAFFTGEFMTSFQLSQSLKQSEKNFFAKSTAMYIFGVSAYFIGDERALNFEIGEVYAFLGKTKNKGILYNDALSQYYRLCVYHALMTENLEAAVDLSENKIHSDVVKNLLTRVEERFIKGLVNFQAGYVKLSKADFTFVSDNGNGTFFADEARFYLSQIPDIDEEENNGKEQEKI